MDLRRPLSRRHFLGSSSRLIVAGAAGPMLLATNDLRAQRAAVGEETVPERKTPPSLVSFQPSPKDGLACTRCEFYEHATRTCEKVEGKITPAGWCVLWAPKGA